VTATALSQSAIAPVATFEPQTIETLDYLADLFLDLQRKASEKYRGAFIYDQPLENLREKLIGIASDVGTSSPDGSKILSGTQYEIRLTFGASNYFDPLAVTSFRYSLLRRGVPKGTLPEIFEGSVRYQFRASAKSVIDRLRLPAELLVQYESCRSKTPILTVSPLSVTSP
jgi:hypothetical protein